MWAEHQNMESAAAEAAEAKHLVPAPDESPPPPPKVPAKRSSTVGGSFKRLKQSLGGKISASFKKRSSASGTARDGTARDGTARAGDGGGGGNAKDLTGGSGLIASATLVDKASVEDVKADVLRAKASEGNNSFEAQVRRPALTKCLAPSALSSALTFTFY